jgi:hypothetical protein
MPGETAARREALLKQMIARPNDLDLAFEYAKLSSEAGDYEGASGKLSKKRGRRHREAGLRQVPVPVITPVPAPTPPVVQRAPPPPTAPLPIDVGPNLR